MFDPAQPSIAVAFVVDSQNRLLLAWNTNWDAFSLPMTKIDPAPPSEHAADAAIRAASEVLGIPTRLVAAKEIKFMRCLQKSKRDGKIKDYQHQIVAIEPHPDFALPASGCCATIWAPIDKLRIGEYMPISQSVADILKSCVEWGWV